jgi:hypothetical protein
MHNDVLNGAHHDVHRVVEEDHQQVESQQEDRVLAEDDELRSEEFLRSILLPVHFSVTNNMQTENRTGCTKKESSSDWRSLFCGAPVDFNHRKGV